MIISVSDLGKRFNREWIFKGLTQEFESGNIYALVGPNGSGKSTLMKILWGQVPPSVGAIQYSINDNLISVEEVFQHLTIAAPYMDLIEEFTLREQVEFHFKFKRASAKRTIDEVIDKTGLGFALKKLISQFSSGMKQRLKLGLAFASESEAIFLDEPTTNLDVEASDWYMANLLEIKAKKLIFIATNQASDYPAGSILLNLNSLKQVTKSFNNSIQSH